MIRVPAICISASILAGCLLYLMWLSPLAVGALSLLMAPMLFGYTLLHRRAVRFFAADRDARDGLYIHFRSVTEGAKELKMHRGRRLAFLDEVLRPQAERVQATGLRGRFYYEIGNSWTHTIYFVFILVLLVLDAMGLLSAQVLVAYALVALYMRSSMAGLLNAIPFWSYAGVALKKIAAMDMLIDADYSELEQVEPTQASPHIHLKLRDVVYTYRSDAEGRTFSLGPLNLDLRSGEVVFVTGGNGSGKTTFVKVLTGLYPPDQGQITFNCQPILADDFDDFRQNFSVLFADYFLFEGLYGLNRSNVDASAKEYIAMLELDGVVSVEDERFSTTELSKGQRSRLALLSAYIEDRPIYVFDEWAANQDPGFKEIFYRQLLPALRRRGKLVVVISHDDRYFGEADRLIKLDFGRVEVDAPRSEALETAR
ncbi:MAG: cyclic peptide export ABC transporter [Caldilineaceae bacterium]|nr:cyclic peptide export ABC transporter [Caldilineaceae bacterium]